MAVPPSYGDLGKAAKDLFSKGFNYGSYKVEAKTKSPAGVEFKTNGSTNHDSGKFTGTLETKYHCTDTGIDFVEKWNTDNTLGTEITMENNLAKGLKLTFEGSFAPQTGKKSGKIKTAYKRDYFNGSIDADFDFAGPTINASAVTGYQGWLAGYQMAFDTSKSKLVKSNFALGYKGDDIALHTSVNDGSQFGGSVYHRVSPKLECGVELSWTAGSNATSFGMGALYKPDRFSTFRAKLNNASQVGLCFQHKVKDGVTATASTLLEGKQINAGGHKVGFGLEFEA